MAWKTRRTIFRGGLSVTYNERHAELSRIASSRRIRERVIRCQKIAQRWERLGRPADSMTTRAMRLTGNVQRYAEREIAKQGRN